MARTFPAISSAGITCLPSMWPQRLGKHLVFDVDPRHFHLDQALRDGGGVDGIAAAGIDIGHHGDLDRADNVPGEVEDVFHVDQADVGTGQQAAGQAEAADLGGGKAAALSMMLALRVS